MPFDDSNNPRNLLQKLIKYKKVLDVPNSITYLPDMFKALETLVKKRAMGIYNMVNPGAISPYQIMQKYKELVDPKHEFERLTLDHLSDVVKAGRSNCVLSSKKIEAEGIRLLSVDEAIEKAMRSFA
jgi:3,5-epimerase/4-reductase